MKKICYLDIKKPAALISAPQRGQRLSSCTTGSSLDNSSFDEDGYMDVAPLLD